MSFGQCTNLILFKGEFASFNFEISHQNVSKRTSRELSFNITLFNFTRAFSKTKSKNLPN